MAYSQVCCLNFNQPNGDPLGFCVLADWEAVIWGGPFAFDAPQAPAMPIPLNQLNRLTVRAQILRFLDSGQWGTCTVWAMPFKMSGKCISKRGTGTGTRTGRPKQTWKALSTAPACTSSSNAALEMDTARGRSALIVKKQTSGCKRRLQQGSVSLTSLACCQCKKLGGLCTHYYLPSQWQSASPGTAFSAGWQLHGSQWACKS